MGRPLLAPSPAWPPTWRTLLLAIVALQAVLLLHRLEHPCLWTDEMSALGNTAHGPLAVLVRGLVADWHPPLHEAVLAAWRLLVPGADERVLRLPSVLATLATTPLLAALALETTGPAAALLATLLFALSPAMLLHGRVARYYALATCLATGTSLAYVRASKGSGRWRTYALASAALLWTESTGALVLAAHAAHVLLARADNRARRGLAGALAGAGLLTLPWWWAICHLISTGAGATPHAWMSCKAALATRLVYSIWGLTAGETLWPWSPWVAPIVVILATACVLGALGALCTPARPGSSHGLPQGDATGPRSLLWLLAGVPWVGGAVLVTLFCPFDSPQSINRVLLPVVPPVAILTGGALVCVAERSFWRGAILAALLVALELLGVASYFAGGAFHNTSQSVDWRVVAATLRDLQTDPSRDLVVCASEPVLAHYCGDLPLWDIGSSLTGPRFRHACVGKKRRIFLIERLRGERAATIACQAMLARLRNAGFVMRRRIEMVPIDPVLRALAEWATGSPIPDHALDIHCLDRQPTQEDSP